MKTKDGIFLLILVLVNVGATTIGFYDPTMRDKLFEFYLAETAGLYGYLQQPNGKTNPFREKGQSNDSSDKEADYNRTNQP